MLRLENIPPEEMNEVVRVASELYERDQAKDEAALQRQATVDAAEELGLPAEYLHRAATELHARKVERIRQQRRRRKGLVTGLVVLLALIMVLWGFGRINSTPPAVPVQYSFTAASGGWRLNVNPESIARVDFENGTATIRVERFGASINGTYFVNLDSGKTPPTLAGYKDVQFRVRGTGLSNMRLYLENGALERWRSPAVAVTPEWTAQTLRLDQFEYQTRPSTLHSWRVEPYRVPGKTQKISFKAGHFINDVNAKGEVSVDDLEFR